MRRAMMLLASGMLADVLVAGCGDDDNTTTGPGTGEGTGGGGGTGRIVVVDTASLQPSPDTMPTASRGSRG